jgi:hypothetical protein
MNNKRRKKILNKSISRKKKTYKKKRSKVTHKKTRVKRSHKKTRGKKGRRKMGQKRRILRGGSDSEETSDNHCDSCPMYGQCQTCLDKDEAYHSKKDEEQNKHQAARREILNKLFII